MKLFLQGLIPFLNIHNQHVLFMQENAAPHRTRTTRAFLQANNVNIFGPWPVKSPDMNPIENLWSQMKTAIQRRPHRPTNRDELCQAVQEEWANINLFDVRHLVLSMRRRCSALVNAAGHHTPYWLFCLFYEKWNKGLLKLETKKHIRFIFQFISFLCHYLSFSFFSFFQRTPKMWLLFFHFL